VVIGRAPVSSGAKQFHALDKESAILSSIRLDDQHPGAGFALLSPGWPMAATDSDLAEFRDQIRQLKGIPTRHGIQALEQRLKEAEAKSASRAANPQSQ
jgi:hypothetical protein